MLKMQQHVLNSFAELVQVMLDTSFIYVDRQLVPDEIYEPNYMPPLLKERFRDLLFGGLLFECEPASSTTGPFFIYEVGLACDTRIAVLCLPEREGFVLIGPYLPDAASTSSLEELLTDAGIPFSQKSAYSTYLNTLPVLDHSRLYVVFSALVSSAYQRIWSTRSGDLTSHRNIRPPALYSKRILCSCGPKPWKSVMRMSRSC